MFARLDMPLTKRGLWHKIKRYFFATPICAIERDGTYVLAYHWKDGTCEIVKHGFAPQGSTIQVPAGTVVKYEVD